MKRATRLWLNGTALSYNIDGQRASEVRDEFARQAAELRALRKALKVVNRAVGLEIVPEHDAYATSPEKVLVDAARNAIAAALKPARRKP